MKTISVGIMSFLLVTLSCGFAGAWSHASRFGGSMSHSFGSTSHTSAWGTSTSHSYGEGTSHTNVYGGSTSHGYGEGTEHTNMYGGSAEHYEGGGWSKTNSYGETAYGNAHYGSAYHPPVPYAGYHPPTTVDYYGSRCYNCGGWSTAGAAAAGAAVGMVAGAAIASANTAAATSNAYNAGVAAGSPSRTYVMGATYGTLPSGCAKPIVQGTTYYLCGNTWFQPSYGANGVYYRVVQTP
jgi:hypothetical protein